MSTGNHANPAVKAANTATAGRVRTATAKVATVAKAPRAPKASAKQPSAAQVAKEQRAAEKAAFAAADAPLRAGNPAYTKLSSAKEGGRVYLRAPDGQIVEVTNTPAGSRFPGDSRNWLTISQRALGQTEAQTRLARRADVARAFRDYKVATPAQVKRAEQMAAEAKAAEAKAAEAKAAEARVPKSTATPQASVAPKTTRTPKAGTAKAAGFAIPRGKSGSGSYDHKRMIPETGKTVYYQGTYDKKPAVGVVTGVNFKTTEPTISLRLADGSTRDTGAAFIFDHKPTLTEGSDTFGTFHKLM